MQACNKQTPHHSVYSTMNLFLRVFVPLSVYFKVMFVPLCVYSTVSLFHCVFICSIVTCCMSSINQVLV